MAAIKSARAARPAKVVRHAHARTQPTGFCACQAFEPFTRQPKRELGADLGGGAELRWSRHPGGWVSIQVWRLHDGFMGPVSRFVLHSDELEAVSRALLAVRQSLAEEAIAKIEQSDPTPGGKYA